MPHIAVAVVVGGGGDASGGVGVREYIFSSGIHDN